jgi:hypothetical protein
MLTAQSIHPNDQKNAKVELFAERFAERNAAPNLSFSTLMLRVEDGDSRWETTVFLSLEAHERLARAAAGFNAIIAEKQVDNESAPQPEAA